MDRLTTTSVLPAKLLRDQLVTVSDLQEFKEDLLLSLARLIKQDAIKQPKKWLKSHEVKTLLGISNGTLYSMRINGSLPFTKIGNIIYYDQEDVNSLLSSGRKKILSGGIRAQRRGS